LILHSDIASAIAIPVLCTTTVVTIGFESSTYEVREDEGVATLAVVLLAGNLEEEVTVSFLVATDDSSDSASAEGNVWQSRCDCESFIAKLFLLIFHLFSWT